jgi:hypothetical protein
MSCLTCGQEADNNIGHPLEDIVFKLEKSSKTQKDINEMATIIQKSLEKPGFPQVIGKDLPRLVSKVQTKSEKMECITSPVVQLLYDLSILLLPTENVQNPKNLQESFDAEVKATDYETLNTFLVNHFGADNFVILCLKAMTQATLARPIIILKQLFMEQSFEFKDDDWKIEVTKDDTYVHVIHKRSERVDVQPDSPEFEVFFRFSWKLFISYKSDTMQLARLKIEFGDWKYYEKVRRGTNKNGPTEPQVKELLACVFDFVKEEIIY